MLQESPAQLFALFSALVAPHSEQKSPMPNQSPLWPFVTGAFARRILFGGEHSSLALIFSRRPLHCSCLHKQHVPLPSRSIDRSDESPMNLLGEPRSRACYELGRKSHRNADFTISLVPSRSPFPAFLSRF